MIFPPANAHHFFGYLNPLNLSMNPSKHLLVYLDPISRYIGSVIFPQKNFKLVNPLNVTCCNSEMAMKINYKCSLKLSHLQTFTNQIKVHINAFTIYCFFGYFGWWFQSLTTPCQYVTLLDPYWMVYGCWSQSTLLKVSHNSQLKHVIIIIRAKLIEIILSLYLLV